MILDHQKKVHYKCIFFTSRLYHSLEQESVIPLFVFRGEPSEYHSMAAPAALLDALVVMLGAKLERRLLSSWTACIG